MDDRCLGRIGRVSVWTGWITFGAFGSVAGVAASGCDRGALTNVPVIEPDIVVDPTIVGFGRPAVGVPVEREITVSNLGNADLVISSVDLMENDAVRELNN